MRQETTNTDYIGQINKKTSHEKNIKNTKRNPSTINSTHN